MQLTQQLSLWIYDQYTLYFHARDFTQLVKTPQMSSYECSLFSWLRNPPLPLPVSVLSLLYVLLLSKCIHYRMCVSSSLSLTQHDEVFLIKVAEKYSAFTYFRRLHHSISAILLQTQGINQMIYCIYYHRAGFGPAWLRLHVVMPSFSGWLQAGHESSQAGGVDQWCDASSLQPQMHPRWHKRQFWF